MHTSQISKRTCGVEWHSWSSEDKECNLGSTPRNMNRRELRGGAFLPVKVSKPLRKIFQPRKPQEYHRRPRRHKALPPLSKQSLQNPHTPQTPVTGSDDRHQYTLNGAIQTNYRRSLCELTQAELRIHTNKPLDIVRRGWRSNRILGWTISDLSHRTLCCFQEALFCDRCCICSSWSILWQNNAVVFNHFIGGWEVHAMYPKALRSVCPGERPSKPPPSLACFWRAF